MDLRSGDPVKIRIKNRRFTAASSGPHACFLWLVFETPFQKGGRKL